MRKRTKVILGIGIPLILITGGIIMTRMTPFDIFLVKDFTAPAKESIKQMQIDFLKEHEQKMTDFVKEQNPKVTSVQFDWESVQTGTEGNGTPQGGGDYLQISGRFNNIEDSGLVLTFWLDKTGLPILKTASLPQGLGVGGKDYE